VLTKEACIGLGRTAGLKKKAKTSLWGSPRGSGVHLPRGTLCEGTTSHKLYGKQKDKVKQGENVLFGKLIKETVTLFAV
jgi:hypothetical protein